MVVPRVLPASEPNPLPLRASTRPRVGGRTGGPGSGPGRSCRPTGGREPDQPRPPQQRVSPRHEDGGGQREEPSGRRERDAHPQGRTVDHASSPPAPPHAPCVCGGGGGGWRPVHPLLRGRVGVISTPPAHNTCVRLTTDTGGTHRASRAEKRGLKRQSLVPGGGLPPVFTTVGCGLPPRR